MSRIGKIPVDIPEKVKVQVSDQRVEVEGPKGKLSLALPPLASVAVNDNQVVVTRADDTKPSKAQHGLTRSLVQNMVCLLYTSPSPRDVEESRMPSSA